MTIYSGKNYLVVESDLFLETSATGEKLLLVHPTLSQVEQAKSLGWSVYCLALNKGMQIKYKEMGYTAFLNTTQDWHKISELQFQKAFAGNDVCGSVLFFEILMQIVQQKPALTSFYIYLNNPNYYQNLMNASSLDMAFWPSQKEEFNGLNLDAFQNKVLDCDWVIGSTVPDFDENVNHPNLDQIQVVNGLDSHVKLNDKRPARLAMTKGWKLVLKPRIKNERMDFFADVEKRLSRGDLLGLEEELIARAGEFSTFARYYNCLGILYYYKNSFEESWSHFERAVEIDPKNLDYYRNWMDVADAMGAGVQIRARFAEIAQTTPLVASLIGN